MDEVKPLTESPATGPEEFAPTPIPQTATTTTTEPWGKVRQIARRQLDRFMSFEPKVLRGDDPGAIHDIRVASRRLQSVLNLLCPKPRPTEVQRLRRQVRRCRRALGRVRNCDALIERVEKRLGRKRTARREAWTAIRDYLLERRSEDFQKALRRLGKLNLPFFYVNLKRFLSSNGAVPPAQVAEGLAVPDSPASQDFPQRFARELERVWGAFQNQIQLSHRDQGARVIHGARIATKRLRYLIEVGHRLNAPGSAEVLAWLRQLQTHLGDWHDLQVLERMMIEMVARPAFLRDHLDLAMEIEKLILANRSAKKRYEDTYTQMTRDSREFTRLKEWVGYLLEFPSAAFA